MQYSTFSVLTIFQSAVSGVLAGILVNYLADVLPTKRRLVVPFCLQCQNPYQWLDYILLKRCKNCKHEMGTRHWFVLALGVVLSIMISLFTPVIGFWPAFIILIYFGLVIVIDLEHRLVMHPVSISGAILGFGIGIWQHGWLLTLAGALTGFLIMLALYYLGIGFVRLLSRKRGIPEDGEGIGFGDVILSGVMGIFLGWPGVLAGMALTILLGGLVSLLVLVILLIRKKYQALTAIPYAPFIALSTVILLFLARH